MLCKKQGISHRLHEALCIISKPSGNSNRSYNPKALNSGQNWRFFVLCDLEIWRMTLKNYRAPFLCYFKLCASYHRHWSIQIWVTVLKRQIRVKIGNFVFHRTVQFYGWPWKTIGHVFYATSSFMHHFIAISQFKLALQSGNSIYRFNGRFFASCVLEMWHMTLKNNAASLLCYFKLCASFRSHLWIQTVVMVRPNRIKIGDIFCLAWPWKFDGWPWKTTGHLSYATSSFVHHLIAICEFSGVIVRKRLNCASTSVTLTFDIWRPFAWTSLLSMMITAENWWW